MKNHTNKKIYHSVDEIEKEFFPKAYQKKMDEINKEKKRKENQVEVREILRKKSGSRECKILTACPVPGPGKPDHF